MEIPTFVLRDFVTNVDRIIRGGEANVFIGSHPSHGEVAIKKWEKALYNTKKEKVIQREVKLLMENPHEHIIEVIGLLRDERSNCIGYVMPLMTIGSLRSVIHDKSQEYDEGQISSWIIKICYGISHLHLNDIIHRDINPNNIGTGFYMAPEMLKEEKYTFSADIYSLSITIWEILHRRCWHANASERPEIDKVLEFYNNGEFQITALEEFSTGNDESKNAQKSTAASKRVSNSHDSLYQTPLKKPNLQVQRTVEKSSEKQTILLLGGQDENNCDSVLMLENNGKNWKQLNIKLPYGIHGHGAQFLNNNLYIFGRVRRTERLNWTYKLSKSLEWTKLADMNTKREKISNSSVVLNNQIWVCGGDNSVEMYDPETNKWKYMKKMNTGRFPAAAAVVNGKIFCSGGEDINFELSSIECYDPLSDVWTLIFNMPQKIRGHGAVEINGNLIVIGGVDGKSLNSVWALQGAAKVLTACFTHV